MTDIIIDSFDALHAALNKYRSDKRWYFRGHASMDWSLLPKVGRPPFLGVDETAVFEAWKRQAIEYVTSRPQNDWDWLAIAQHHGLSTRLLDWTTNPLNASFFAVREVLPGDAVVYAAQFKWAVSSTKESPLSYKHLAIFRPHRVVPRITRQGGLFTVHPKPSTPLDKDTEHVVDLHRLVIRENYRETLLSELSYYGVNASTLFPDLDGLSTFVNWTIQAKEYWKYSSSESAK